jgi:excinuclease ABC subunit A
MGESIIIRGAKEHNLKNINLELPRNQLIVITGLSGSGKSSLAFDTIYAEGQRRFVESLSSYARQFLERLQKPDVEYITGLSPAIAIEQRRGWASPRSTVATQTEIYDYLRLFFARLGTVHCYKCSKSITRQSAQEIIEKIWDLASNTEVQILAPLIRGKKGEYREIFSQIQKAGFVRARVDGKIYELPGKIKLAKHKIHNIEVVVDRLIIKPEIKRRLTDSVETALKVGKGIVIVHGPRSTDHSKFKTIDYGLSTMDYVFSEQYACAECGISYAEVEPRIFSFNSPYGACPECNGLGTKFEFDLDKEGVLESCPLCKGAGLRKESLAVKINDKNIWEITQMSIKEAFRFFKTLELTGQQKIISHQVLKGIIQRLQFCIDVGLDYLTLARKSSTLSGGEAQRIRLATQVGSGLVGVLYILDEPSIGLHQRDNQKLLSTLMALRDLGNTLMIVEHDESTIRAADFVVDLGPGAGRHGGEVIFSGKKEDLLKYPDSLTAKYLRRELKIEIPAQKRSLENRKILEVVGAREHNLKNIDVRFPLGTFICVTGVSGSGKSTLIDEILFRALSQKLYKSKLKPGLHKEIIGAEYIAGVIVVDQSPIGRTPRSNPVTYTGVFSDIRDLFSSLPQARIRGYKPGRFSFNVKGGRCQACSGDGMKKIEMHFLPDVYVKCAVCNGLRFNESTLEVKYKGASVADVLEMTVEEGLELFSSIPKIKNALWLFNDVGLGYLQLGQSATTLSGGEAQRVKLSSELGRRLTANTLYILDEPTTGLHFADVAKLLSVLQRLVDKGNTVVVIEHNLEVIKCADYIIDLGPEGGDKGGYVVATGSPEELVKVDKSYTGQFLKKVLNNK